MFRDFVKYTIIIRVGLNHCFPEHGVYGDKLLPGPVSAVWLRTPQSSDLSATCCLLWNHPGCACYPNPIKRMENRQLLIPAPLPRLFSLCWAWSRLKAGGSCYMSLCITYRDTIWGGEGISTSDLKSVGLFCRGLVWEISSEDDKAQPELSGVSDVPRDYNGLWACTPGSYIGARKAGAEKNLL